MLYDVIISISMNICLLIVLALLLIKSEIIQKILLNKEENREENGSLHCCGILRDQLILGCIFGSFCIISDYIGIQVSGALPNARVIGVLSAGFLGGPVSGMLTAVIAAVHRYLIFPERISTVACVISALLHGVLGSLIGYSKHENKQYSNRFLLCVTFLAEAVHMLLILALTRPFPAALEIVKIVLVPMVIINSFGMVLFFGIFKTIFNQEDMKVASSVSLALRTAERCTSYLLDSEQNRDSMQHIMEIIMQECKCAGVALVHDYEFLGRTRAFEHMVLIKTSYPRLLSATKTYRTTRVSKVALPEDAFYPLYEKYVILSAPIVRDDDTILSLVMLMRKNAYSYGADFELVTGLANYFATQFKLSDMERQKEHLRKAELKALQSQINPHFLFNALNTISCFCREKPEKARELLMTLSTYFRNMLEDMDQMVTLETELEHVRAYLMLEEARFEDHLQVIIENPLGGRTCFVPNLILQPIVENAVQHGAARREKGIVSVKIQYLEASTQIDVSDNGPGIDKSTIDSLYISGNTGCPEQKQSHGIGMLNVQHRLVGNYGKNFGLQILSGETGATVRINIPHSKEKTDEDSSCR